AVAPRIGPPANVPSGERTTVAIPLSCAATLTVCPSARRPVTSGSLPPPLRRMDVGVLAADIGRWVVGGAEVDERGRLLRIESPVERADQCLDDVLNDHRGRTPASDLNMDAMGRRRPSYAARWGAIGSWIDRNLGGRRTRRIRGLEATLETTRGVLLSRREK